MVFTAAALVWDVRTRKIPNWLNLAGLLVALAYCSFLRGWSGFIFSIEGFSTGFAILFLLWIVGGGGGGDVKLMSAVGAWMGPMSTLIVFVFSGLLTGIGQIAISLLARGVVTDCTEAQPSPQRQRRKLPYAVPVAIASWIICGLKLMNS